MTNPVRAGSGRPLPTVRWDPLREIEDAWTRMGSLLGDVAGGGERRPYGVLAGLAPGVDVEETPDEFVVELEVPGVRAEDLSIDLRDSELFVTGELRERERQGTLRRQTRRVGRFEHVILLPGEVDPDAVKAGLDDGVLTVRLAKARRSQPRRIEISGGAGESGRTIEGSSAGATGDDASRNGAARDDAAGTDSPQAGAAQGGSTGSARAGASRGGSSRGSSRGDRSGAEPKGTESKGTESKGAESKGTGSKGAGSRRAEDSGGGLPDAPTPFGQSSFGAAQSSGPG